METVVFNCFDEPNEMKTNKRKKEQCIITNYPFASIISVRFKRRHLVKGYLCHLEV